MPDTPISPEEVDTLIRAAPAGGDRTGREIRPYDFVQPEKFSKEQIRVLEMIWTNAARGLSVDLTQRLRLSVEVKVHSLTETVSRELRDAVPPPIAVALVRMEPLPGHAFLEYDPESTFCLLDRMLGGPGNSAGGVRELTDIEKILVERVAEGAVTTIAEAWRTVVPLRPRVEVVTDGAFFSRFAMEGRVLLTTFSLTFGTVTGYIKFGIPAIALDPVLPRLKSQEWSPSTAPANNETVVQSIRQSLDRTHLEASVELGGAEVSMRDLLGLQAGDVICLDRRAGADLDLRVGPEVKFRGQPGQIGRRMGFKITQVVEGES